MQLYRSKLMAWAGITKSAAKNEISSPAYVQDRPEILFPF